MWLWLWAGLAVADSPRVGVNFMRYHWDRPGENTQSVADINGRVTGLGVDAMRQMMRADLVWRDVEATDNQWDFSRADAVLLSSPVEPVVTLFSLQYASPTPPWARGESAFQSEMGPEAVDYVTTVVKRYAKHVRYWEVGNEMDHWRAADPGAKRRAPGRLPPHRPSGGFTPEQQGKFVADVAAIIRRHDSDAVILMPGMAGLSPYVLQTWLPGFVKGAGLSAFDVVGYHFYGSWTAQVERRKALARALSNAGLGDKPVWLTETGSTSAADLRQRTNYPNSPESQAADVFRRIVSAWGQGDRAVFWHSFVDSPNRPQNRWRGYGLFRSDGTAKPAHAAMRMLAGHLKGFKSISRIEGLSAGQHGYRFELANGTHRWVFWGTGTVDAPTDPYAKGMASVVPGQTGKHAWRAVPDRLTLSAVPWLLRD